MKALTATEYNFPGQKSVYHGKVRDVYNINDELLVMVATDRISAFDVILPKGIPFKGQILNQIAAKFLDATTDICPNWKLSTPDPMVTAGVLCEGFPVEMIVRGYLCGSAWRAYKSGIREICGVKLPDGMKENQKFPTPIITPTTKAEIGEHDADISKEEILAKGLATPEEYELLEKYTLALFARGTEIAAKRGLILVDTKYEFGKHNGEIYLMDEIHTPDSSRYFYADGYQEKFEAGLPQKQLSKEFVREWLMDNGFQGKAGQQVPEMTDEIVESISQRYIELYEHITGEEFKAVNADKLQDRIEKNVTAYLKTEQVTRMFDKISHTYDRLNHTLSLGIDRWWRRYAINKLKSFQPKSILDIATGTGDFAIQAFNTLHPNQIIGIDISEGMMSIARDKIAKKGLQDYITFQNEDCCKGLSFKDNSIDAVTVAFGARNFAHLDNGLLEMQRVLRPDHPLVLLELSVPVHFPMKQLFWIYAHVVMPFIGRLISHDDSAYTYLPSSMEAFPQAETMEIILKKAGFSQVWWKRLTFGICTCYVAIK